VILKFESYTDSADGMKLSGPVSLTAESKLTRSSLKLLLMPSIVQKSGCQHQPLVSIHLEDAGIEPEMSSIFPSPFCTLSVTYWEWPDNLYQDS